jgi:hypothetical protein
MLELPGFGVLTLPVFQSHIMISVYKYVGHTEESELHKNGYLTVGCHDKKCIESAYDHLIFPFVWGLYLGSPLNRTGDREWKGKDKKRRREEG